MSKILTFFLGSKSIIFVGFSMTFAKFPREIPENRIFCHFWPKIDQKYGGIRENRSKTQQSHEFLTNFVKYPDTKMCTHKYPCRQVDMQPLPPSFACAKARAPAKGFIERQRLQLDMMSPLGGASCFRIKTTAA